MKKTVIALLLIMALLCAGCGSTTAQPTETPAQTETPAATETPEQTETPTDESEDSLVLEPMASYISYQVTVTEVLEEFIQTTTDVNDADNYENTINYVPGEDTLVFDAQGNQLSLGDVKAGDLLTVYTGAYTPAPMIMPPQYQAEIIIIEDLEAESPVFTCADTFVADEEGMLVGLGNTLALNMSEDVEVVDREGQAWEDELENMDLLVFYDAATKSVPAQTTPLKVVVLGENELALSNINDQ